MNVRTLATAAALTLATTFAMADDITIANDPVGVSTLTREQVRAEFLRARDAGQLPEGGEILVVDAPAKPAVSTLTREQVRAEARTASRTLATSYLPA